ncbi:conserved hypothetical protein [Thioalkalivibrio sp. K90mix]|uniref:GTPase family protein n=1 Tax=Thioalkalivibrio sp. (strain K90mix) TaxID=396595 RepID=UPI000195AB58|nr:GTPase domain-containing protein [Thioalkalivibrio sp. K90mix]ADC71172.1 conserved hypothetical protein [Thioalkalivibrio sp. K90mix]
MKLPWQSLRLPKGLGWRKVMQAVLRPEAEAPDADIVAERAREQAPVLWLLGKVQSGKSTLVRAITGDSDVAIGTGFRSCTRTARAYDFPAEAPVLRFLDTRGLGEVAYDPSEDLAELAGHAHMVVAVARAMDLQQEPVLNALRDIRRRHPNWPVLLVQTCLHDGYPDGRDHPPYAELDRSPGLEELARARRTQAEAFRNLPGTGPVQVVPVDITPEDEGFTPTHYGLDALLDALEKLAPERMGVILQGLRQSAGGDARRLRARSHILGYASVAATTDAVPLLGLFSVPAVQGKLLHSLASIYGVTWDSRSMSEFSAALGSSTLLGLGLSHGARQVGKLVPVYGQTAGAAAAAATSFATTYALGYAARHYLARRHDGREATAGVEQAYRDALREALNLARHRQTEPSGNDTR